MKEFCIDDLSLKYDTLLHIIELLCVPSAVTILLTYWSRAPKILLYASHRPRLGPGEERRSRPHGPGLSAGTGAVCSVSFSWREWLDSSGKRHICVVVYLVCTKAELASGLRDAHSESCRIALHRGN